MKVGPTHLFISVFFFFLASQNTAQSAEFFLSPSISMKMFYERHPKKFDQYGWLVAIWTGLAEETKGTKFSDVPDEKIKKGVVPAYLNPFAFWENRTDTLSKIFAGWMTYLTQIKNRAAKEEAAEDLVNWLTHYTDNAYEFALAPVLPSDDSSDAQDDPPEEIIESLWLTVEPDELARIHAALDRLESEVGELDPSRWTDMHKYLAAFSLPDQYLWVKAQKEGHSINTTLKAISALHKDAFGPTPFLKNLWTVELDRIVDAFPLEMNIFRTESSSALEIYLDYKLRYQNPQKRSFTLKDIHAAELAPRDTRVKGKDKLAYKGQSKDVGKKVLVLAQPRFGRNILFHGTLLQASGKTIQIQNKNTPEGFVTLKQSSFTDQTGVWAEDFSNPQALEVRLLYVFAHSPGNTTSLNEMLDELFDYSGGVQCGAIVSGDRFLSP